MAVPARKRRRRVGKRIPLRQALAHAVEVAKCAAGVVPVWSRDYRQPGQPAGRWISSYTSSRSSFASCLAPDPWPPSVFVPSTKNAAWSLASGFPLAPRLTRPSIARRHRPTPLPLRPRFIGFSAATRGHLAVMPGRVFEIRFQNGDFELDASGQLPPPEVGDTIRRNGKRWRVISRSEREKRMVLEVEPVETRDAHERR
jgi:hypothetical protein